jgi:hypothetical protein
MTPTPTAVRATLITLALATTAHAGGLQDEVMLHPMDGFTADTLPAGQVIYNQSIATLPVPSWSWIGVTDWMSVEIDTLPLIGGFFQEPHLPVPSVNVRTRLREEDADYPGVALETMWQHLWRAYDQEHGAYRVTREGSHLWAHLNASQTLAPDLRLHVSAGASFTNSIEYALGDDPDGAPPRGGVPRGTRGVAKRRFFSPDLSVALDWRPHRRWSFHATGSYGTTFIYSDNQPRKWELAYGFRVAPFLDSRRGWLRTLRMEFPAIVTQYRDLHTGFRLWVPIVPYVYWQFELW